MSGIYIPGMEMPQRDEVITIYSDGTAHLHHIALRLRISESKAVPVPEHGDLKDLRKLIDEAMEKSQPGYKGNDEELCMSLYDIGQMLINAPTIIPADKETEK